jgi:hypothetical protein
MLLSAADRILRALVRQLFHEMERTMNFEAIIIGCSAFIVIGIFHPIVIWTEYYLSEKAWPLFLLLAALALYIASRNYFGITIDSIIAIVGFSSLWSIGELYSQKRRVEKGWFPKNPKRKAPYAEKGMGTKKT